MKRKLALAVVAGMLFGVIGLAAPAGAAQPARQACVGDLFNGDAPENGGPVDGAGVTVSFLAKNKVFGTFGQAIQALQTGTVPDEVFPNSCNPDEEPS